MTTINALYYSNEYAPQPPKSERFPKMGKTRHDGRKRNKPNYRDERRRKYATAQY